VRAGRKKEWNIGRMIINEKIGTKKGLARLVTNH
jgi:hypothetical protein